MEEEHKGRERSIFRDIRRYYCKYCGICRSKKTLITCEKRVDEEIKSNDNTCQECGAFFNKPAYLKQHMQSHSLERPFTCPVDDCHASYRRKDHLTRHLIQHEGKVFRCPIESCNREFSFADNVKRHVRELHCADPPSVSQEEYACPEAGCGKVFRYPSKLKKHEDSHVKLDSVEAICLEPGCMKYFSNDKCLKAHVKACHQYITCEVCGTKQLKKNIKRHLRSHEGGGTLAESIKCHYKDCQHRFSTKTNLNLHVKAVHLQVRHFACGFKGCDASFAYKHVRDNHEKSGCHVYTPGNFESSDEQFRSRPRGGRKRKFPTIETLIRKRVTPPTELDDCHSWFHPMETRAES
ncbi:hypothetical protein K2173_014927 [Erythroxylum novogranatense]|uniref:C2H2-type domain-containing protein n=1 Tax=Erythroxylum novogranatense TaxID=1862640 RepID=A0AAV8TTH4_9ROSI|nr:hypothetical protein K2173_014927 [Erythroxylum novogranatense]